LPLSTSLGMTIGLHSFEGWPFMFKVKDHEGMSPSKHILSSWGQGLKTHFKLAHNAPMPLTHPLGTSSKNCACPSRYGYVM